MMISSIASSLALWIALACAPHAGAQIDGATVGAPLNVLLIGDAGEPGAELSGNARWMAATADELSARGTPVGLLLFLGDNFYPNGLNHENPAKRTQLIADVLGPHDALLRRLGRQNVHAIAGNHDYYCGTVLKIPYGACDLGNGYEAAIDRWTYHYHFPALVRRATAVGARDSVDFILFDSALLLTQDEPRWRVVLDSLERLLRSSAAAPGVSWRVLAAHHSPYSVGEHAGYRLWMKKERRVGYIGNCFEDRQDPLKYVEELVSEQDNCTRRYRAYTDSLMRVIGRSGAKIQVLVAGHDHSLQVLHYPERNGPNCPKVFVVSGAGAKRGRVKKANPPREYTHALNDDTNRGLSAAGFTRCSFADGTLEIVFHDSDSGKPLEMGGATVFVVDRSGGLTVR